MPKRKPTFDLLFSIVALDNIASAIVLSVLMYLLFPCQAELNCRNIGISDNTVFLSGFVFLLSPSYIFASPAIGRLSDLYGRKFALRICLILSALGYLLLLIANSQQDIILTLTAILLLNAGSSSMTIVQAAAIDVSAGRYRAYLFGLIAFVLMPLYLTVAEFGELLLDLSRMYPYIRDYIIMLAWLITVGNLLMLYYYKEPQIKSIKNKAVAKLNLTNTTTIFSKQIILLLILFAVFEFATSWYFEDMVNIATIKPYFAIDGFTIFLYYKITLMIVSICLVYPFLIKRYSAKQLLITSLTLCCISIIGCTVLQITVAQWLFIALFTFGEIIFIPVVWYLVSEATSASNQGLMMGLKGALWSLTWSLGLIVGNKLSPVLSPLTSAILVMLLLISSRILAKYVLSAK